MKFEIIYHGMAIPKARPKVRVISTRAGKTFPVIYTPKKTTKFESDIKYQAGNQLQGRRFEGALELEITFCLERPKSLPKKVKYHVKKPDIDNLVKSVLDALNGVAFIDDKQIVKLTVFKMYGIPEITIRLNDNFILPSPCNLTNP